MKLTKRGVLRINEWNESNRLAREDYYANPFRHCRVDSCDGIHSDNATVCADHLNAIKRIQIAARRRRRA